jgi:hypothetical protein
MLLAEYLMVVVRKKNLVSFRKKRFVSLHKSTPLLDLIANHERGFYYGASLALVVSLSKDSYTCKSPRIAS